METFVQFLSLVLMEMISTNKSVKVSMERHHITREFILSRMTDAWEWYFTSFHHSWEEMVRHILQTEISYRRFSSKFDQKEDLLKEREALLKGRKAQLHRKSYIVGTMEEYRTYYVYTLGVKGPAGRTHDIVYLATNPEIFDENFTLIMQGGLREIASSYLFMRGKLNILYSAYLSERKAGYSCRLLK